MFRISTLYIRTSRLLDIRDLKISSLFTHIRYSDVGPERHHLSFRQWMVQTYYPETFTLFIEEYNKSTHNPWLRITAIPKSKCRYVGVIGPGFPEFVPFEGTNGAIMSLEEVSR